jgi:thiamine transport system ATP-binding protein
MPGLDVGCRKVGAQGVIELHRIIYEDRGFRLSADCTVPEGSLTAIIGPNGAGKSTLLSLIAGFETPREGRIFIGSADVTDLPPAQRPISMLFQDNNSFAHLDAWTNVALGMSPSLNLDAEARRLVDFALDRTGILALRNRKPGEMSGGERQRIAIARALVRRRKVLLLDEPFAALGPALRRDMLLLIDELRREHGNTVLMVTHHPDDVRIGATHVMFIENGGVRDPAGSREFFEAAADPAVVRYLGEFELSSPPRTAAAATATARGTAATRTGGRAGRGRGRGDRSRKR